MHSEFPFIVLKRVNNTLFMTCLPDKLTID